MKDFMVTMAGVLLGSLLFILVWGTSSDPGASLRGETGQVMKSMVRQIQQVKP